MKNESYDYKNVSCIGVCVLVDWSSITEERIGRGCGQRGRQRGILTAETDLVEH